MKQWYRFSNNASDPTIAEIHILDFIGDWIDQWIEDNWGYDMGVTAKKFLAELAALPEAVKTIRVHINSPGGDVFAALTIANALRDQQRSKGRTVETFIDGLAASAASVIAMAGGRVVMADNALLMIHNPWTIALGEAKDFRKAAEELDTVRNTIVATYKWHATIEDAEIVALMDATTWMDASEARDRGFATDTIEGLKAAASINPKAVRKLNVPEKYKARVDALLEQEAPAPAAASAADVLAACKAGHCLDLAEDLIRAGATLAQVQAKVGAATAGREAEATRVRELRAICEAAKQPGLADDLIRAGITVDAARPLVTKVAAAIDAGVEIDGTLPPAQGGSEIKAGWKAVFARVQRERLAR